MKRLPSVLLGLIALAGSLALAAGVSRHTQAAPHLRRPADDPGRVLTTPTPLWTPTPGPTVTPTPVVCAGQLQDVPPGYPDGDSIYCVVCRGIITPYPCGGVTEPCVPPNNWPYYRPEEPQPPGRADVARVISRGAGLNDPVPSTQQTFADVPPSHPDWIYVERVYMYSIMTGYNCGGVGEPCDPQNRPYFRPAQPVRRDQFTKIVVNAAGWSLIVPPSPTFTDVPSVHAFYVFIETIVAHGVMGGYSCGGVGEPCDPQNRPYFRPSLDLNLTRREMARVIARAFIPSCVLSTPTPTRTGTPPTSTPTRTATPNVMPTVTVTRTPGSPTPTPLCTPDWRIIASPNSGTRYNTLQGVAVLAPDNVWAVGYWAGNAPYRTLIEHWDGNQWSIVPSPNIGSGDNLLTAVAAISPTDIWAVGQFSPPSSGMAYTLALHWDGSQWSYVATPNLGIDTNVLTGVAAIAANDVWAVGWAIYGAETLTLHWDGQQWSRIASPNVGAATNQLWSVAARAANDVWAVGFYTDQPPYYEMTLTLHWNGQQWSVVPSPNSATQVDTQFRGVAIVAANDVWAVGIHGFNPYYQTISAHWDGSQWSLVNTPNFGTAPGLLLAATARAPNEVWAAGYYFIGGITRSLAVRWDGSQWSVVPSPNIGPLNNVFNAIGAGPGDLWAVGFYFDDPGNADLTLAQRYGGAPCATITPAPTSIATATATVCPPQFTDVAPAYPFYPYIQALACRGLISGYSCGGPGEPCDPQQRPYYRPGGSVTRGQTAKIVANAANFQNVIPSTQQTFADVPPSQPFWLWVERIAGRGIISGYSCGGPGEPCDPQQRPYFRPGADVRRGQLAKIVSESALFSDPIPSTQQTFADVPPSQPFWLWIERVAARQIISGYTCGGMGEPCDPQNRPYFRAYNTATRAQTAKIVVNTFP